MSNTSPQHIAGNIGAIFAQFKQQDVEEFYTGYQYWNLQHRIEALQIRLDDLRKQIIVNTERMQELQPTAVELATLARLQSNGVSDVDLLERMLERGESWLDRTMQRLDYLEQLDDFISEDYTQWCQHALEGAYDWIDSVLDGTTTSSPATATTQDMQEEDLIEATEELFLQKISTDEDEELMQAITVKRPSVTSADLEEAVPSSEDTHAVVEVTPTPENTPPVMEEANSVDTTSATDLPTEEVTIPEPEALEAVQISEEALPLESGSTTGITSVEENEHPPMQEPAEKATVAKTSPSSPTKSAPVRVSSKRPSLLKRFFGKIWGS